MLWTGALWTCCSFSKNIWKGMEEDWLWNMARCVSSNSTWCKPRAMSKVDSNGGGGGAAAAGWAGSVGRKYSVNEVPLFLHSNGGVLLRISTETCHTLNVKQLSKAPKKNFEGLFFKHFKHTKNAACVAPIFQSFIFKMSALSAIAFIGVIGLHAKTPKQLFIHFTFFSFLIIAPPQSCKLRTMSLFIPFFFSFFRHNLSRVFEAQGRFYRAFRRANVSAEFKKQAIHTVQESVCLCCGRRHEEKAREEGRRERLCTQLKRHPTEKKIFSTFWSVKSADPHRRRHLPSSPPAST